MVKGSKNLADLAANRSAETQAPAADEPVKLGKSPVTIPAEIAMIVAEDDESGVNYEFATEGLLTASEKRMYVERRQHYYNEFNLNTSSDVGLVHRIIMEEVMAERLYTLILNNPNDKDLNDQLTLSHKRYQTALETLGASRDKRIRNKEASGISIADIAKDFFREGKQKLQAQNQIRELEDEAVAQSQDEKLRARFGRADVAVEDLEDDD